MAKNTCPSGQMWDPVKKRCVSNQTITYPNKNVYRADPSGTVTTVFPKQGAAAQIDTTGYTGTSKEYFPTTTTIPGGGVDRSSIPRKDVMNYIKSMQTEAKSGLKKGGSVINGKQLRRQASTKGLRTSRKHK